MLLEKEKSSDGVSVTDGRHTIIGKSAGVGKGRNTRTRNIAVKEGIHLACITRGKCDNSKPTVLFYAEWISRMGFSSDVLVQALPEDGGLTFTLCNENIPSYSELLQETKGKGGALIHPTFNMHKKKPSITISGMVVKNAGLNFGDNLIAKYEYGLIRTRKLPDDGTRIVNARIYGRWLEELGFLTGEIMTIDSEPGLITCTFIENGLERVDEIVKHAREKRMNLVQLRTSRDVLYTPMFEIPQSRLEKAGFLPDDAFHATCEYGRIQLQKLDCRRYGF
ncbi:MAG: type I toxin-antitoxin system SymE family toxin [Treponema sp.]|nr:type I toxin-antitoxin system SymE family toxin [Treponema sp.]